jgi:hypothetical protein
MILKKGRSRLLPSFEPGRAAAWVLAGLRP